MGGDYMNYIWPGFATIFPATTAAETKTPLENAKEVEDAVNANLKDRTDDFCGIMFYQLIAMGWTREKAHKVKLRLGLTQ